MKTIVGDLKQALIQAAKCETWIRRIPESVERTAALESLTALREALSQQLELP